MTDAVPTTTATALDAAGGPIIARRDKTHYIKRCILIPGLILFAGLYFLYDGYIGYPNENRRHDELSQKATEARDRGDVKAEADLLQERKGFTHHDEFQLRLQRQLGYGLLPLAVVAFVFFSRQSRGQYRLEGDVLHAPGHPPVPLDAIREIDKTKWDRKGIAYLGYEFDAPAGGTPTTGTIKLDDALYEQQPTTAILRTIEATLAPGAGNEGPVESGTQADPLADSDSPEGAKAS